MECFTDLFLCRDGKGLCIFLIAVKNDCVVEMHQTEVELVVAAVIPHALFLACVKMSLISRTA